MGMFSSIARRAALYLTGRQSAPPTVSGMASLYALTGDGEVYVTDGNGLTVQVTNAGAINAGASGGLFGVYQYELLVDSNVTLSGEQTLDGVLTSTSRIFLVGQTDASENGGYVTAAGAWARVVELDSDADLAAWKSQAIQSQIGTGGTEYGLSGLGGLMYRIRPDEGATALDTDDVVFEVVPGEYLLGSLTGAGASLDVQNIPPCFDSLHVEGTHRSQQAAVADSVFIEFNGDGTAGNYDFHWSANDNTGGSGDNRYGAETVGASSAADMFAHSRVDIWDYRQPHYTSVTSHTTNVYDWNRFGYWYVVSWLSSSVVNQITFKPDGASWAAETKLRCIGRKV